MKQEIPTAMPEMQPAAQPVSCLNFLEHHSQSEPDTSDASSSSATANGSTPGRVANCGDQSSLIQTSDQPHVGDLFLVQENSHDEDKLRDLTHAMDSGLRHLPGRLLGAALPVARVLPHPSFHAQLVSVQT